jgi:GMP synthase-like glutamine amidotransferase
MSVNDDLPWIAKVETLIRDAVAKDVPLLGHCLGGQLISKALGAVVSRNPVKEIGWGEVQVADNDIARSWFGGIQGFEAFHWHGETFSLPHGATHLLSSAYCANQAYAIGKHLALQCHVEMTAEMIAAWCAVGAGEITASRSPAVQPASEMQQQMNAKLPPLNGVAARLYGCWINGLTT